MGNFDRLEARTLFAAAAGQINVTTGEIISGSAVADFAYIHFDAKDPSILVVEGTKKGDQLSIGRSGDNLVITNGSNSLVAVAVVTKGSAGSFQFHLDGKTTYAISKLSKVIVNGANGNDLITVSDKLSIPVEINGGNGNDTLSGGSGNDTLLGGKGNDSLLGNLGDDEIHGNIGDDSLNGGRGFNKIFGDAGTDSRPKKGPGFDYRIDSIESNAITGQSLVSISDLQKYFDGVSVVKLDDGRLVAEVGFTYGDLPVSIAMTQPKNKLGQFEIDVTANIYRNITGGSYTLTPRSDVSVRLNSSTSYGSFFINSSSDKSNRRAFDLGKLASGDYKVAVKSGDTTLGEYDFSNTTTFKGQRVDATNFLKYNSKLPTLEELLKQGSGITIIRSTDGENVYVNYAAAFASGTSTIQFVEQ